ncbi:MAG: metal ABC transporter substrate-binding protein, partial [Chitinivibrionales bacterium]
MNKRHTPFGRKLTGGWKLLVVSAISTTLLLIYAGCTKDSGDTPERKTAFVSILPHAYFAQRIGGEHFDIETLIGTGQNPHNYSPTPGQIAKLSTAQLFFRAGVEFENAMMPKIKQAAPKLDIIDLRRGIRMREFDDAHQEHESHEHEPHHE